MKIIILPIISLFILISSCKKEKFVDTQLTKNGWVLEKYSSTFILKPDTLKHEIYLYFSTDNKVVGHLVSRNILSGKYSIEENGNFVIEELIFPSHPSCSEWEQYFIDKHLLIYKYELDGSDKLYLYYEGDKKMEFIRQ